MFLDLVMSMGLKRHVFGLTHKNGDPLDLLITREHDSIIPDLPMVARNISDHATILGSLNSSRPEPDGQGNLL